MTAMRTVNVQQAKTHLSRLLEDAARGEVIVIAKAGKPYVRLVPCGSDDTPRRLGALEGQIWIAPDFDRGSEEIADLFEAAAPRRRARAKRKRGR